MFCIYVSDWPGLSLSLLPCNYILILPALSPCLTPSLWQCFFYGIRPPVRSVKKSVTLFILLLIRQRLIDKFTTCGYCLMLCPLRIRLCMQTQEELNQKEYSACRNGCLAKCRELFLSHKLGKLDLDHDCYYVTMFVFLLFAFHFSSKLKF